MKTFLLFTLLMLVGVVTNGQILFSNDSIFIDGKFTAIHTRILTPSSKVDSSDSVIVFVFKPINKNERWEITRSLNNLNGRIIRLKFIDIIRDNTKLDFAGAYLEKSANRRGAAIIVSLSSGLIASIPLIVSLPAEAGFERFLIGVAIAGAVAAIVLEVQSINNTRKAGKALRYQIKNETSQENLKNFNE